MKQETSTTNMLETAPIGKLILKYPVPTALTLMVNYLYNIADQIFVGQGVGVTGMAATNIAFPLTIVAIAIALMLGDGSAANISLFLGRKQPEEADKIASHALTLLIGSALLLAVLCTVFAPQLVKLLGATKTSFDDALAYTRIIIWGLPFLMFSSSLNALIRADGNPQYTMKCMIAGAVINLVLDPVFIFLLKMGVVGAGIATIIGQAVGGFLCLRYMRHLQNFHIVKSALRPTWARSKQILALGIPSLITQLLTAAVQIITNNLMQIYGAHTVYGSDMALSVYGMIMKIYQIAHSMFVGVSSATQPIHGYNFGAKQYDRVKQTYKMAATIAIAISVFWFLIYQIFPRQIGMLFVTGDELYLDCVQHFFHYYMLAFFIYGLHMSTSAFFQGIGKSTRSLLIPLSRQAIILIPLSIILAYFFGLDGALLAAPVADVCSFIIALTLALTEFRNWKRQGMI